MGGRGRFLGSCPYMEGMFRDMGEAKIIPGTGVLTIRYTLLSWDEANGDRAREVFLKFLFLCILFYDIEQVSANFLKG